MPGGPDGPGGAGAPGGSRRARRPRRLRSRRPGLAPALAALLAGLARWSRWPGPARRSRAARRPAGAARQERQAQGQLVAALDVEEGARRHRRRVRRLRACHVRRATSTCRAARRSPPRSRPRPTRTRPSTTPTARRSSARSAQTNRQDLTYAQIPKQLQNAVVAAEDKNFWTEGGISPTGILRAAIHDVTSGGGDLNGGSTITQEFVRGYYDGVGTQQTASRKIKEIFIAQKLSRPRSKQWIMTNYLNTDLPGRRTPTASRPPRRPTSACRCTKLTVAAGRGPRGDHPAAVDLLRCWLTGRRSRPAGSTCSSRW